MDRRLQQEKRSDEELKSCFNSLLNYIPDDQILKNLGLFQDRITIGDILFIFELYKKQQNVHGVIAEFGVRWGKNLSLLIALRGVLEPHNHTRKILGFDTFNGLTGTSSLDGKDSRVNSGEFSTGKEYAPILKKILNAQEQKCPIPQIKKNQIIIGDVRNTLDKYLEAHPETIFSMIYFDMDIYAPTKYVLEKVKPHICKGTIIGFDEACNEKFPGETIAILEQLDLSQYSLKHLPYSANGSYIKV